MCQTDRHISSWKPNVGFWRKSYLSRSSCIMMCGRMAGVERIESTGTHLFARSWRVGSICAEPMVSENAGWEGQMGDAGMGWNRMG
jgi:hypothetical protein